MEVTTPHIKHSHYHKSVAHLSSIDVYRVLALFEVTDSAIAHAVKKLLASGRRGQKDSAQDVQEAIDSLLRWQNMQSENLDHAEPTMLTALQAELLDVRRKLLLAERKLLTTPAKKSSK